MFQDRPDSGFDIVYMHAKAPLSAKHIIGNSDGNKKFGSFFRDGSLKSGDEETIVWLEKVMVEFEKLVYGNDFIINQVVPQSKTSIDTVNLTPVPLEL